MLHALVQKKVPIRGLFQEQSRVPLEDIVTSTIFGPLAFMSGHDRKSVLSLLSQEMRLDLKIEADPCLDFWKRRPSNQFRSRSVEPDLVITLSPLRRLIVEI